MNPVLGWGHFAPYHPSVRTSLLASRATVALGFALTLLASPLATAGKTRLNPEDAADQRAQIEGRLLSAAPRAAIDELERAAQEHGDPELFLSAARRARDEAAASRVPTLAARAEALALIAADIGVYLSDRRNYSATQWRPISSERAMELAREARILANEARALTAEIEAEIAAAEAEAARQRQDVDERRELAPGTGMIIGGSVALVLGAGGVGMFGAGLAMGSAQQREAEALAEGSLLPAELPLLDEIDRKGATANTIAIAGGAVAGVGIIVGAALIAVGVKKRKAAGPPADARARGQRLTASGWFHEHSAGLTLGGSF